MQLEQQKPMSLRIKAGSYTTIGKTNLHLSICFELPALNHFSIMDALADENVPLHKALLAVMKVEGFF